MQILRTLCVALLGVTMPLSQVAGPPPALDAEARRAAIEKAADLLRTRYIFPEVGEAAARKIEAELKTGTYETVPDRWMFAQKVSADLQSVMHDKHVRIYAGPPPAGSQASAPPPPINSEFGVVRADRLDGDIGYVEVSSFPPPERFRMAVDPVMDALKDAKALIIDVRRCSGGSPDAVGYLVSHFVGSKPMLLHIFFSRTPGTATIATRNQMSVKTPTSYRGKPVYVLTSARTFSGGEEFAYDMQTLKLATLVGETTGGGANGGGLMPIGPGMNLFVPISRQENPVTKTNWEGVGVKPEVITAKDDALKVALEKLGQHPAGGTIEALSKASVFAPRTTERASAKAALARMIAELRKSKPNYDLMSKELAQATRQQLPEIRKSLTELGDFVSASFRGVEDGMDGYDVAFANGRLYWRLLVDKDGTVIASQYRREPS